MAETRRHSRESQEIRADSEWFPDEPAFAEHEQRALPIAQENHRGAGDDDDRFRAAEYPHGGGSQREDVVFQPSDGDAGEAGSLPDRFLGGVDYLFSDHFYF